VSTEVVVLALTTVIRPTSAAAVLAILSTPRPQRLLVAYIVAGLAFSLAVGALVVLLLQGIAGQDTGATRRPVVEVLVGGIALGYAAAVGIGWLPRSRDSGAAHRGGAIRGRLEDPSPQGAAAAGVLTHLPGLIYLAALNAIAGSARGPLDAMVQVVVYNAIWFSLAIAALVLSVRRPEKVRDMLVAMKSWVRRHGRVLIVVSATAVGGYFMVIGLRGLAPHLG
jgi:hypothetical protein